MSHIWTFAPSSKALIKRCLEAAAPEDPENKWVKQFKRKRSNLSFPDQKNITDNVKNNNEVTEPVPEMAEEIKPVILDSEIDEIFFDSIEAEPSSRVDFIVEECLKNQKLIIQLAERLSAGAVEKICNILFSTKDRNDVFLDLFYQLFFPAYLKKEYSLFSLDLLVKAEKSNQLQFKKLLQILFRSVEIPSKVLLDFFQTLDEEKKFEFILKLTETELNTEQFIHHLFTIYTAFKDNNKNERINNFILMNLVKNGHNCASEKNYGRLLLAYLQAEKENPDNDVKKLEKIIEMHRTPFKKPCFTIYKEILEKWKS